MGTFFLPALALLMPLAALAQIEAHQIPTRPGVTLRFVHAQAAHPVATAILFQGGGGNIGVYMNGSIRSESFLSGGAGRFMENGISVAIPDVPSDRNDLDDFRDTPAHAQDNAALIAFLRKQHGLPVWVIGTSNGSLSAASTATHLKSAGPDGIVLTSSTTRKYGARGHPVTLAPLHEITQPVLVVHHKHDPCQVTPYDAMPELLASLKKAGEVELITVEGGRPGNPCNGGYHQFLGIESDVTRRIADWIKRIQSGRKQ